MPWLQKQRPSKGKSKFTSQYITAVPARTGVAFLIKYMKISSAGNCPCQRFLRKSEGADGQLSQNEHIALQRASLLDTLGSQLPGL